MNTLKESLRKITPHFILDIVGRYDFIKKTELFSERPFYSMCKLSRWMFFVWTKRDVSFRTPDGTRFVSMPYNLSSFFVCFTNYRDPAIQKFMTTHLKTDAVYVDAGANIGTYSVRAGQYLKHGQVISFEAHPLIFSYFERNIKLNGLRNVRLCNVALGAENGETEMAYSSKNAGETHIATPGEQKISVPLRTLDSALMEMSIREIDYLKIDVEGFELPLLKGSKEIVRNSKKIIIQTELNNKHAQRYNNSVKDLTDLLMSWGLAPHSIDNNGQSHTMEPKELEEDCDVLWWREQ
ncbi:MAG: putative Methyltransferase FkbM family [Candidatus Parcubacteria bacterium]|nr:putative Methyltransferase FkbM family [Candidatus Parcubacteria bacterium]